METLHTVIRHIDSVRADKHPKSVIGVSGQRRIEARVVGGIVLRSYRGPNSGVRRVIPGQSAIVGSRKPWNGYVATNDTAIVGAIVGRRIAVGADARSKGMVSETGREMVVLNESAISGSSKTPSQIPGVELRPVVLESCERTVVISRMGRNHHDLTGVDGVVQRGPSAGRRRAHQGAG